MDLLASSNLLICRIKTILVVAPCSVVAGLLLHHVLPARPVCPHLSNLRVPSDIVVMGRPLSDLCNNLPRLDDP